MKIETTKPKRYEDYMIVGLAIEAPILKAWKSNGIIYNRNSRKELKRLDTLKQAVFWNNRGAQDAGLKMCRYWIDNYRSELDRLLKVRLPLRHRKSQLPNS